MEAFDGRKAQICSELTSGLQNLRDIFAHELSERLQERDASFAVEKDHYLAEIEVLRHQAVRVDELEVENRKLAAELKSVRQAVHEPSGFTKKAGGEQIQHSDDAARIREEGETVDIKEYNRLKDELAKSNEDYGKIFHARKLLASRLQDYKDLTRQWREYRNKWISKESKKHAKSFEASRTSPRASTRDPRSTSAPAPPSVPDGQTPSVSDISWPASPCNRAMTGRAHQHRPLRSHSIIPTDLAHSSSHRASSDGLTEGSDEPQVRIRTSYEPHDNASVKNSDLHPEGIVKGDHDGDDSPIIISERSLKRKRPVHVHKEYNCAKPLSVKDEPHSSSPIAALIANEVGAPHDSLDLDDVGGHIVTPRKRRKMELLRSRSLKSPMTVQDEDGVSDDPGRKSLGSGFLAKGENLNYAPPINDDEQQRRQRKASTRAQQQAHNDRVYERLVATAWPDAVASHSDDASGARFQDNGVLMSSNLLPRYTHPKTCENYERPRSPQSHSGVDHGKAALASSTILQPTDPNARILPRTNEKSKNPKASCPPSRRDRGAAYVPALAEDGDDSPSINHKPTSKQADPTAQINNPRAPDAHHRLGTLLNEPSPEKALLEKKVDTLDYFKNPAPSKTPKNRPDRTVQPKAPITPLSMPAKKSKPNINPGGKTHLRNRRSDEISWKEQSKPAQATSNKTSPTKPSFRQSPPINQPADDVPENEPLRSRPLHRLRLDDFKLNPAHSDYAYHESVRKHDEKKRLSGCTDRNCLRCKDFHKYLKNSEYARIPGQDAEETDRRLIEEYIGGDKRRLNQMSAAEKKNILEKAQMQQFADKVGKHKTYFPRATTPVDYWNTEFPSTQEVERNREVVRMREREKVEEMYWEAVRKGGRWAFADEL